MDVLLLLLQGCWRVCFALQSLLKDRCSGYVCSRAVGTVEVVRNTKELLPPSSHLLVVLDCEWRVPS